MSKNIHHFLAFLPDEQSGNRIKRVLAEVGALFDTHGIPVRLVKPEHLHITVLYMGKEVGWLSRKIKEYKISKHNLRGGRVSFGKVRLGISRTLRELLFLTVEGGADELRNMVYELSPKLKIKRDRMVVLHLSLGRVNKEITDQEFRNLNESIMQLNNKLGEMIREISFDMNELNWIRSQDGVYSVLRKFPVSSSAPL